MPQTSDHGSGHSGGLAGSPWLALGLIVLAVSAVYSNSLRSPFVFDDLPSIVDNPTIRSPWRISQLLHPPGEGRTVQGRPVVNLSLAVNYALGGEAVLGYHLVNLAVHVLAALVLFGIVRRTLLLPGRPQRLAGQSAGLALAIALLWGVHPLATAAVSYVVQRAESLMALFYLLTLYCVIRSAAAGRRGLCLWQAGAVLACLLGMGCKEVMVSAPLVVLVYDRVFLSRSWKESFRQRGFLYAGLAASWMLLAWLVITVGARGGSAGFGSEVRWWHYALTQCRSVVTYLKLCFWPHPLVFDYGTPVITDPLRVWPQALLLALVLAGVLAAFRRQPWIGFLGACFLAVLAPSSSVLPVTTETMAERRMYLPLAIVVALTVLLVRRGAERIWAGREQHRQWRRWSPALALAATAILLGGLTLRRNADYHSALGLWTDTIRKCPDNSRAYNNRGNVYLRQGSFQESLADYERAIALKPDHAAPHNNRGQAYQSLGQFRQALADFNRAIALKPDFAVALYHRGTTYLSLGQPQAALEDFTRAIAVKSDYLQAYQSRSDTYRKSGQFPEALEDYNRILALQPHDPDAYNNRGSTYMRLGQFQQAIEDYTRAVALKPDLAAAFFSRAIAFYNLKQYDRAWADVVSAQQLGYTPPAEFLRALGEVSGRSGN